MATGNDKVTEVLVRRAQGGDEEALVALYRHYLPHVYRYVHQRTPTRADAEDLTSEIFLRMVENLAHYRGEGPLLRWLFGIARNVVRDFWRRQYRMNELAFEDLSRAIAAKTASVPPSDGRGAGQMRNHVLSLLQHLPPHYRRVLELRFLEGKSVREVADIIGCSESTVKVRQHRALKQLAQSCALPLREESSDHNNARISHDSEPERATDKHRTIE